MPAVTTSQDNQLALINLIKHRFEQLERKVEQLEAQVLTLETQPKIKDGVLHYYKRIMNQ